MKKQWWHDKIAYQIYPKSFYDSNGDGVGDVEGIIQKLDYLKELGVDIIWLSPIYKTPFVDQGYDIADYYDIDPLFGSLEDMDRLLEEAKKRDMYILMDLVVNHCSSEHEWFKKAIQDPDGEYGQYFIIRSGNQPPNNWRSYFGGSVWDRLPGHEDKYYLHCFAKEQPDLNWENPKVVEEIYKNINWWLERGLKGFRIDAIVNIKKEETLSDLPVDGPDNLADCRKMLPKAKGLVKALQELHANTFAKHDAFTVAELFDYDKSQLNAYIGDEGCFSTIFDFSTDLIGKSPKGWYGNQPVTPKEYRDAIFESTQMAQGQGYLCNIIENHDEPRGVSRYLPEGEDSLEAKKALGTIFMLRHGLPFFYQGQEIGMTNCKWESIEEIDDIATIDQYNVALQEGYTPEEAMKVVYDYSRDNARTPMQWSSREYAGFSKVLPWLKVNPNYKDINVESQIQDESSLLNYYKSLVSLRKDEEYKEAFVYGKMSPAYTQKDTTFGFYRIGESKKILVLVNMSREESEIILEDRIKKCLSNNVDTLVLEGSILRMQGFQALVFEIE